MTGIVTVTPAAAIDLTYHLSQVRFGEVNRADAVSTELSGKGVNVARAVALSGHPVSAVLPLGADGLVLAESAGVRNLLVVVPAGPRTRVNTTLVGTGFGTTKINESPLPLDAAVWEALIALVDAEISRLSADWLVLSGSMPRIADGDMVPFSDLLSDARDRGVRVAIDTAGIALEHAVRRLDLVALLKPNTHELAELTGRTLRSVGDVAEAARELHRGGCDVVYVSMGADGALALSADGLWHARARAQVVNTAGAGDASLAGFLVGSSIPDPALIDVPSGLATAASWGALAVSQATTVLTSLDGAPNAVLVRDPDPATELTEPATP
ncbi:MAG: PfkB family carbohydrate kinase [Mycetocola sp.]